jgi:hypothetical protein
MEEDARAHEMLIIAIAMFVRRKTSLLCAYCLLGMSALAVVAYDAHRRGELTLQNVQAAPVGIAERSEPVPFAPIAQSPFPEARPDRLAAGERVAKQTEASRAEPSETAPALSGIYFLKVAVRVQSGDGPLSFGRGTEVRLVRQQDGKLLVTRDGTDFLIEKTHVTKDRKPAARVRNSS